MKNKSNKASVILRYRLLDSGMYSIYLDIYENYQRRTQTLGLKVSKNYSKVKNILARDRQVMDMAMQTAQKIELEISSSNLGINYYDKELQDFYEFMKEHKLNKSRIYEILYKHLQHIAPAALKFKQIDYPFLRKFIDYLQSKELNPNSIRKYVESFKSVWLEAMRFEITQRNPFDKLPNIKKTDVQRDFLEEHELQMLIKSDYVWNKDCKNAFLFSCFTGLRYSDLQKLTWAEVENGRIRVRVQKTQNYLENELTAPAKKLLETLERTADKVFPTLPRITTCNKALKMWTRYAGLKKHISFHCGRHTCATLLLTNGAEIYYVAKLLGHTDIKMTMVYLHMVDSKRRETAQKMPDFDLE